MPSTRRFKQWLTAGLLIATLPLSAAVWADVTITPSMLESRIEEYIQDSTPLEDTTAALIVELVQPSSKTIYLKGDNLQYTFEDNRPTPLTFRTTVQVTMSTDEESYTMGIPVRLAIEKPVWVTKRFIRAREPLTSKDVTLQTKRLTHEAEYAVDRKDNVTIYTSKVNLIPGSLLDTRKLSVTPTIYRNDNVRMILSMSSGVNVSIQGQAMEDGVLGKRIRVQQKLSNHKTRTYTGEVINKTTVMVRM